MIQRINSAELHSDAAVAADWNDLWTRTVDVMPLARAESLACFLKGFDIADCRQLTASDDRGDVAGLALVKEPALRLFRVARTANNPWLQCGGMLVDQQRVTTRALRALARQIKSLPLDVVILDWMTETIEVQRLVDQLQLEGCRVIRDRQFETGIIRIHGTWTDYMSARSSGFRKKLKAALRKLGKQGDIAFHRYTSFESDEHLQQVINTALDIEHSGWKGREGSSLNSDLRIRDCFVNVLREIAAQGMLEIQFLRVGEKPVAFEIGFRAHTTYYSYKIGFDPAFGRYSPGQLLMYFQMKNWFDTNEVRTVDTVAEINEATARWTNDSVTKFRYTVATRAWSSSLCKMWFRLKPLVKQLVRRQAVDVLPNVHRP